MSRLTYDQIAGAITELPQFDKQRLFGFLLDQLGLSGEQRNGSEVAAAGIAEIEAPDPRPNYQWLEDHKDEFRGQWVALYNGELIAHGADGVEVVKAVNQTDVKTPLIHFIEPADAPPFAGF